VCKTAQTDTRRTTKYLDTLTYKDISNISRNMHKARSSQLPPLQTYIEETHEALSAVRVWTSSKELACKWLGKKYCNVFLQTVFSSIDGPYVDGTFKSAPKFFHQLFTIHGLTMCNLHFSYRPINIQRPMMMYQLYGVRGCRTWCECVSNNCLCWLRNRLSQGSDNSVARLGI